MPKISIIVPVYNGAKFIKVALDSLLNQTLKDIEVIIVNDGSIDNTLEVAKDYEEKDSRIKIVNLEKNMGPYEARIYGFENAMEKMYDAAIENDADIVQCKLMIYDGKSSTEDTWYSKPSNKVIENDEVLKSFLRDRFDWSMCLKLFKKPIILKSLESFERNKHLVYGEDFFQYTMIAYYAKKFAYVDSVSYFYNNQHGENSMGVGDIVKEEKRISDAIFIVGFLLKFLEEKTLPSIYKEYLFIQVRLLAFWVTRLKTMPNIDNDFYVKMLYKWLIELGPLSVNKEFLINELTFINSSLKNGEEKKEIYNLCLKAFPDDLKYFNILNKIEDAKKIKPTDGISIIIPVYNTEKYLHRCLDSILNQNFNDKLEIIVVDDCSPGNCKEIIEEYQKKYSNIIYIKNIVNMGCTWTRLNGLAHSTYKYIHFVDSDDWVVEDCYKNIYGYLNNKYDCLYFNAYFADDEKYWSYSARRSEEGKIYGKHVALNDMFFNDPHRRTLWCRVYERSCVLDGAKYMPKMHISVVDDWILNIFSLFFVKKYRSVSDTFYYYYQDNPNAMTANTENKNKSITAKKINNDLAQIYAAYRSIPEFFNAQKVWHLYRSVWSLYIARDMDYLFINMFDRFEDCMRNLYKSDKEKYIEESKLIFNGHAKHSEVLKFIREQLYASNNFSERKLWQLARTTWFYKLTYKLASPLNIPSLLFSIKKINIEKNKRLYITILGIKITIKLKDKK